jgi:dUTPase
MSLNLKVVKMSGFVNLTQRAEGNAGFDLYATEEGILAPGERVAVPVGISTSFNPEYICVLLLVLVLLLRMVSMFLLELLTQVTEENGK